MDFLKEVVKNLDLPLDEKRQVMKELETHYSELREEFVASGMSESRAAEEAGRKLGDPVDVAQKMQSVHCKLGWRTALIMALPVIALQLLRLFERFVSIVARGELAMLAVSAAALVIAVTFLYPSVRDWRAGRRPVWLATWMAGGVSALLVVADMVYSLAYLARPLSSLDLTRWTLLSLLPLLVWGPLGMWLLKDLPRWRIFVVGIAGLTIVMLACGQLLGSISTYSALRFYTMLLAVPAVTVAVGLAAFGRRPYGNAAQASLFLWVSCLTIYTSTPFSHVPWLVEISYAISATSAIIAVLAYARQNSWSRKILVIAFAMTSMAAAGAVPTCHDVGSAIEPAMLLLWSMLFVIVAPLLYQMKESRRRPETA